MAYTITLVGCKGDEIELIAMCMELCGYGMGEASKVVDHMPSILFENINEESANKYKKLLEGAGAILKIDETAASTPSAPDPFSFPEPDFGKMMASSGDRVQPAPEPPAPEPPQPTPEPPKPAPPQPTPEPPKPTPAPEPPKQEIPKQSVVEITPRNIDYTQSESEPEPEPQKEAEAQKDTSNEEPKYEYYGYCPKCGSSFVTVKKVNGLFGSSKVKCVCDLCKHKF